MAILREEYHYNYPLINYIFAISALALVASIIWLIWDDYDRQWKDIQAKAHEFILEKEQDNWEAQRDQLRNRRDTLQQQLEQLRQDRENIDELEQTLEEVRAREDQVQSNLEVQRARARETRSNIVISRWSTGDPEPREFFQERLANQMQRVRELREQVESLTRRREQLEADLDELLELEREITGLERQVASVEEELRRWNQQNPQTFVRNLPLLDYASPTIQIQQVVLENITDDYSFTRVRKVDRCQTCHFMIDRPGFEREGDGEDEEFNGLANAEPGEPPFMTHPRLELFLGADSPHPVSDYGCTICHGGRGRETQFARADHSTTDEEELEHWKEDWGYEYQEFWKHPMKPTEYMESSCWQCHKQQETIPMADHLNRGKKLARRMGCYSCHQIEGQQDLSNPGMSLEHAEVKLDREWTYRWIRQPSSFKHSLMPQVFGLTNDQPRAGENFPGYNAVEIRAITEYIFYSSEQPDEWESVPQEIDADAARGERLFRRAGCAACHSVNTPLAEVNQEQNWPQGFGYDLGGTAIKLDSREWLFNWIKNPKRYDEHASMPDLNLSDREALDIATYIMEDERFQEVRNPDEFTYDPENPNAEIRDYPEQNEDEAFTNDGLPDLIEMQFQVDHPNYLSRALRRLLSLQGGDDLSSIQERLRSTQVALEDVGSGQSISDFQANVQDPEGFLETFQSDASVERVRQELVYLMEDAFPIATNEERLVRLMNDMDSPYRRQLVFVGKDRARQRGCANCHRINGLENAMKIGAPLTGAEAIGDKPLFMFAFNNLDDHTLPEDAKLRETLEKKGEEGDSWVVEHNRWSWIEQKIKYPRSFDYAREDIGYRSKLRMPKFELTDEEVESLTTYMLGLKGREIPEQYLVEPEGDELQIERGKALARENNCISCHRVGTQLRDVEVSEETGFIQHWMDNPSPWFGAYLLFDVEEGETLYQFRMSEEDIELARQRNQVILAERGDYLSNRWLSNFEEQIINAVENYLDQTNQEEFGSLENYLEANWGREGEEPLENWDDFRERRAGTRLQDFFLFFVDRLPLYAWNEGTFHRELDAAGTEPPNLKNVGNRINSRWLFEFLKNPGENTFRQEHPVRMPDFSLTDEEVRTLSRFFYARNDEPYPYESKQEIELTEEERAEARRIARQCYTDCHADPDATVPAPRLSDTAERTKREWLEMGWLTDPDGLEPRTGMAATVEIPDEEAEQALIDYLLTLTEEEYREHIQQEAE